MAKKIDTPDAATWAPPHSFMPGIVWPGIPTSEGALILSIVRQLEDTQWWSPEKLRAFQFAQLSQLLVHAYETVPFYKNRLAGLGIKRGLPTDEIWQRIPLLTRKDIQNEGKNLKSTATPIAHGNESVVESSGSTGEPIYASRTSLNILMWNAITLRDNLWHQRDMSRKLAAMRSVGQKGRDYPDGKITRGWGEAANIISPDAICASLAMETPPEDQLEWLQRQNPEYIITYPSNIRRIAEIALSKNVKLPRLRSVSTLSEVLSQEVRQVCREAFGVEIKDLYSSREIGYMALQCPSTENYHVQSESVFLEVLDDNNQPVKPGETGQIVVTPLHNFSMPLIRYAIGDHAEVGRPCSCGRGLPVLSRILGRVQNRIQLPTGGTYFPQSAKLKIYEIVPIKQYQIIQTALNDLEVRLSVERPVSKQEEILLVKALHNHLGHAFEITFKFLDEIPLGPRGKHEEFISKVAADDGE